MTTNTYQALCDDVGAYIHLEGTKERAYIPETSEIVLRLEELVYFKADWFAYFTGLPRVHTKKAFYRRLKQLAKRGLLGYKFELIARYQGTENIIKTCKKKTRRMK